METVGTDGCSLTWVIELLGALTNGIFLLDTSSILIWQED